MEFDTTLLPGRPLNHPPSFSPLLIPPTHARLGCKLQILAEGQQPLPSGLLHELSVTRAGEARQQGKSQTTVERKRTGADEVSSDICPGALLLDSL